MPFKTKEQKKEYLKNYYEKRKLAKQIIPRIDANEPPIETIATPDVVIATPDVITPGTPNATVATPDVFTSQMIHQYIIIHHGKLNKVIRQLLPIARVKRRVRKYYYEVILEYKDKAIEYFKYNNVRSTLTIGDQYFLLIVDNENPARTAPLFFILKEKIKEGVEVKAFGSYTTLSTIGETRYEADFTDEIEQIFINNSDLKYIEPYKEELLPTTQEEEPQPTPESTVEPTPEPTPQPEPTSQPTPQPTPEAVDLPPVISEEKEQRRNAYIKALIPQLKVNTQLINIKNPPPTFWIIKEILQNHILIEQYKTSTGCGTDRINVFVSFFEDKLNVNVYLPNKYLYNFEIYDATTIYTDGEPFKRYKGLFSNNKINNWTPSAIKIKYRATLIC
jgi:hypothetical protein